MKNGSKVVIIVAVLVMISSLGCSVCRLLSRKQAQAQAVPPPPTNTPKPTFTVTPTYTPLPPLTDTPIPTNTPLPTEPPPAPTEPPPTEAPISTVHVVQAGETLSGIAARYGVTVEAIMGANGLADRSRIRTGQELMIPAPGENVPPPPTPAPVQEQPPPAEQPPAEQPPPAEEQPPPDQEQPAPEQQHQFTAEIVQWWPNCGFVGVARSNIKNASDSSAVNGLRVRFWNDGGVDVLSLVSGIGLDYGPGQYDFALGIDHPIDVVFHMAVWDWQTGPDEYVRVDSEVIDLHFDTNNCQPEGDGHQAVQVDWYRHW